MNTEPTTIIPLDRYESDLDRLLSEAYWNENTDEVVLLQRRMHSVKVLREFGEEYWTNF